MSETLQKQTSPDQDIFNPYRYDWRQRYEDEDRNWNEEENGRHIYPMYVRTSVASAGVPRTEEDWRDKRVTLADNMSPHYAQLHRPDLDQARVAKQLTEDQLKEMRDSAQANVDSFIETCGYDPGHTVILRPQTDYEQPLNIIDCDREFRPYENGAHATRIEKEADCLVTRDPNKILGCRPADCYIVAMRGKDESGKDILLTLHVGWQGLNAGYLEAAMTHLLKAQRVDKSTIKVYISAGAQEQSYSRTDNHDPLDAESSPYAHPRKEKLFKSVHRNYETGRYEYSVDMAGFIYDILTNAGQDGLTEDQILQPEQIAFDGSDTASLESGYSSHSRVRATGEVNGRDLVIVSMGEPDLTPVENFPGWPRAA